MAELTYHDVSRLLKPDFETGRLYWLPRTPDMFTDGKQPAEHNCKAWNGQYAGKEAFASVNGHGYLQGALFYRKYNAHRIIWLLYTGEWPKDQIDHINGDRTDNRITNLRIVSNTENGRNQKMRRNNTSGIMGVVFLKTSRKWRAQIDVNGRSFNLGHFEYIADAAAARAAAEIRNGFHPNHGRTG